MPGKAAGERAATRPAGRQWMVTRIDVARTMGICVRAALMGLLVAVPHLLLGPGEGGAPALVALFALLAAAFTASEYAAAAPSLVEFRDARPFNRLRVLALFATVAVLSMIVGLDGDRSTLALLMRAVGARLGESADFAGSPVRNLLLALPPGTGPETARALRDAAAMAYLASLLMVAAFVLTVRWRGFAQDRAFNVWVNLPQFDPTAGGDVVERLGRDALFNLLLGTLLPILVPMALYALSGPLQGAILGGPAAMVWTVTAWAFIPASLLMRGLALHRVAAMIAAQRARAVSDADLQAA